MLRFASPKPTKDDNRITKRAMGPGGGGIGGDGGREGEEGGGGEQGAERDREGPEECTPGWRPWREISLLLSSSSRKPEGDSPSTIMDERDGLVRRGTPART